MMKLHASKRFFVIFVPLIILLLLTLSSQISAERTGVCEAAKIACYSAAETAYDDVFLSGLVTWEIQQLCNLGYDWCLLYLAKYE